MISFKVFFSLFIVLLTLNTSYASKSIDSEEELVLEKSDLGLEKAFTATCTGMGSINDESFCTYSVIFGNRLDTSYEAIATISINNFERRYIFTLDNSTMEYTINFYVQNEDQILIISTQLVSFQ